MKIAYVGYGFEALEVLKELLDLNENIVSVFSNDKELLCLAETNGIDSYYVKKIRNKVDLLKVIAPEILMVIAWSEIIPKKILDVPTIGTIGIHYAVLPDRRGGAPIAWALIEGLTESGISLYWLDEGIDTGEIIDIMNFKININEGSKEIVLKISQLMRKIIRKNLPLIKKGKAPRIKQNLSEGRYFKRRTPFQSNLNVCKSPIEIHNFIRALTAYSDAYAFISLGKDKHLRFTKSILLDNGRVMVVGIIE